MTKEYVILANIKATRVSKFTLCACYKLSPDKCLMLDISENDAISKIEREATYKVLEMRKDGRYDRNNHQVMNGNELKAYIFSLQDFLYKIISLDK